MKKTDKLCNGHVDGEERMEDDDTLYRYKYRDINQGNLKIITEGTIRFSSPLDFNDPFDSTPAYCRQSIKELYQRRPDLIKRIGDAQGLSPAKRLMNKGKYINNVLKAVDSGEYSRGFMSTVGAFCMSRTPCNPLMWAHYASDHKGFLVEFRIAMDAPIDQLEQIMPLPVIYSDERPILDWASYPANAEDYLLTKSKDWAYEEEERILTITEGPGFYRYSRSLFLHSITAGVRISDENLQLLQQAVAKACKDTGKNIPLYQAQLSSTKYKVFIPNHPDPRVSSPD